MGYIQASVRARVRETCSPGGAGSGACRCVQSADVMQYELQRVERDDETSGRWRCDDAEECVWGAGAIASGTQVQRRQQRRRRRRGQAGGWGAGRKEERVEVHHHLIHVHVICTREYNKKRIRKWGNRKSGCE
jgi:hypothetical protein